jgi:hypothetical protein
LSEINFDQSKNSAGNCRPVGAQRDRCAAKGGGQRSARAGLASAAGGAADSRIVVSQVRQRKVSNFAKFSRDLLANMAILQSGQ